MMSARCNRTRSMHVPAVAMLVTLFLSSNHPSWFLPQCQAATVEDGQIVGYGFDCSYPIRNEHIECADHSDWQVRQSVYEEYMTGCHEYYSKEDCWDYEEERLLQNARQPVSMVNFTDTGFLKIKAPQKVRDLITNYWETNKHLQEPEEWSVGSVFTNHWKVPTDFLNIFDEDLEGGGHDLADAIWEAARETIEEWTGMKQRPSSVYGIRIYHDGAILSPHVDRFPLVSSAILNVAQDVDEDWPLEVYDREGKAINVTMEPGDMVLYESGSLIHGRPFALKGRYYANIFIHFEPWAFVDGRPFVNPEDPDLPPYVQAGSPEAKRLHEQEIDGDDAHGSSEDLQGHWAAQRGDMEELKMLAKMDNLYLSTRDVNGWLPLHEAVVGGHLDAVKYLLDFSRNINVRTHFGRGDSPLALAREFLEEDHEVVAFLESKDAKNIPRAAGVMDEDEEDWDDEDEEDEEEL